METGTIQREVRETSHFTLRAMGQNRVRMLAQVMVTFGDVIMQSRFKMCPVEAQPASNWQPLSRLTRIIWCCDDGFMQRGIAVHH